MGEKLIIGLCVSVYLILYFPQNGIYYTHCLYQEHGKHDQ